jgi:hypothetical protein
MLTLEGEIRRLGQNEGETGWNELEIELRNDEKWWSGSGIE